MFDLANDLTPLIGPLEHNLLVLVVAAALGAALGIVRPVRREIVPRSAHVIQAQILLAIVGAMIIVVVAESLARAFAIVGAAGLVRYRARIDDPKDAGVMLVALAVGLTTGSGLFGFAALACAFVIAVLWLLESLERAPRHSFHLKISNHDSGALRPAIEQALARKGGTFELRGSSTRELHYKVTVPVKDDVATITAAIRDLQAPQAAAVEWETEKHKSVAA